MAWRPCWSDLFSCGRAAPGCGGRRLKSGGIVSGARDSTANSSGVDRSSPIAFFRSVQPEINDAQAKQRKGVRARGARNRYSQDMAQIPPHSVFLMRFASTKQATRQFRLWRRIGRIRETALGRPPPTDTILQTHVIGSRPATGSRSLPRSDTFAAAVFAAVLGALVIWAVGVSHIELAHNAA